MNTKILNCCCGFDLTCPTHGKPKTEDKVALTCSAFVLIWTDLKEWEWARHEDGPHDYAWNHVNYDNSRYVIIPCEEEPTIFSRTPEDDLLDSIFLGGTLKQKNHENERTKL
tara:strand:+ start:77 stop:412 length:336 start_codon:yes stop_codon:yes gene_type:complete